MNVRSCPKCGRVPPLSGAHRCAPVAPVVPIFELRSQNAENLAVAPVIPAIRNRHAVGRVETTATSSAARRASPPAQPAADRRVAPSGEGFGAFPVRRHRPSGPLTQREKILRIACELLDVFTDSDLVVAAWQAYPLDFGLVGYRHEYPSSGLVLSKLQGSTGLIAEGFVEAIETHRLRVTDRGRASAAQTATAATGEAS